jgi:hypothetical protein
MKSKIFNFNLEIMKLKVDIKSGIVNVDFQI